MFPQLEIVNAAITAARADDGIPTVAVRFHLRGEELDRDGTLRIVVGDGSEHEWDEEWTFQRHPRPDTEAVDEQHGLLTREQGGWMFPRRGFVVMAIQRVGAPDPLDPQSI